MFLVGEAQRRVICYAISGANINNFLPLPEFFFHKFIQVRWALLSSLLACCAEVPFDKVIYCTVSSLQSLSSFNISAFILNFLEFKRYSGTPAGIRSRIYNRKKKRS
jgi:hypothetical protein